MELEDLLNRRTDLSTFVVHLTRDGDGEEKIPARKNLIRILRSQTIEARRPFGPAATSDRDDQKVACFGETPLEYIWTLSQEMPKRRSSLASYGLAFTKAYARTKAVNPVWYTDITKGHDWPMKAVNELISVAGTEANTEAIFKLTPFIEQMGTPRADQRSSGGNANGGTSGTSLSRLTTW